MEIEELFCKRYPEYSVNGKPLHPYFDVFEEGYEQAEKENAELEKENAELKAEIENDRDLPTVAYMQGAEKQKKKDEKQLTNAKDIIQQFLIQNPISDWLVKKAEQFLKEIE